MARTKKNRLIQMPPHFNGFFPQGLPNKCTPEVVISFEEYEAIKLCDYELLTQTEAALLMNVSRPTFTRVYESARRKIAKALAEGCSIVFESGSSEIMEWHRCSSCGISFTIDVENSCCPLCRGDMHHLNKIAIATETNDLAAVVGTHFGKCSRFYLFDTNSKEGIFVENPALDGSSEVGCKAADFLMEKGAKVVIAGRFGSHVISRFRKNHIQMVIPQSQKTISEIIR